MVWGTRLHPVSSRHQFGITCRGFISHQNERDPGQKGSVVARRENRKTSDDPPRQHLRGTGYLYSHIRGR